MNNAQIVIIGGGVMGVSLLYHLMKLGWKDVVLVEKNDLTHGSTWHAAGLCTHFAHNPTIQELRATSIRLYRDILPEETGQSTGFHACGAMRVTTKKDRMDEFAHVVGLSRFTGYPLRLLDVDEIRALHPLADITGLIGGIFEPDDGHVDPTLATQAMASVAKSQGGVIKRFNGVHEIIRKKGYWWVHTKAGVIRTEHIVNAAGTWGWEIGEMMGLNIPSVPILHQYLVTDQISSVTEHVEKTGTELPMIRDPDESWYIRQEGNGLILGPYEKNAQAWSVDGVPDAFGADLLPADLDRVEPVIEAAMRRVPALGEGGVKSVINGPITFTPDANPLIGPASGLTNAWLLTGSSMGVMEGGGAGWFLAHWMTHGEPPMDALAIDSRRFGSWADRDFRLKKAIDCFGAQFGIHYPYEERPVARGKRLSALHDRMAERGAVFGTAFGWERPTWFASRPGVQAELSFRRTSWFDAVKRETESVTNGVGLADASVFSKFDVCGKDTALFLDRLGTNIAPSVGRISLTYALTPSGGISSEFGVARLADEHAYLTSAAAAEMRDSDLLHGLADGLDVTLKNVTDYLGVIMVMGPKSRDLLARLCNSDLSATGFKWLGVREMKVASINVRALKVSYIGEMGWELHARTKDMPALFDALWQAGADLGIGVFGAFAINAMRLEKAYRGWGADLTSERNPFETGLGHFVRLKDRQFMGAEALRQAAVSKDTSWQMVLLKIENGDVDPFYAHSVEQGGRSVGIVTSAAYGHRTGMTLGLAYLRNVQEMAPNINADINGNRAKEIEGLSVSILGRDYPAEILRTMPYDPDNTNMRS